MRGPGPNSCASFIPRPELIGGLTKPIVLQRPGRLVLLALTLPVAYLLFWPVPVEPVAWDAPEDRGLVDPFAPNDRLRAATLIDLGPHAGPEDVAGGPDRYLYAPTEDGKIIRFLPNGGQLQVFADVGGRPLGIEFDADGNLLIANAVTGIQRVDRQGNVETLLGEFDGEPLVYADDLAVADDGRIFVTLATSKFAPDLWGGTYAASLLDILEHGGHGSVIEYDPSSGVARRIMQDLDFANGIAISEDQEFLLVNETGHYRIWRHWLEGPRAGQSEVILDNLPGFPDNVNNGLNGRFWIGLVAPRNALLDALAPYPYLRKVVQRLPAVTRPAARPSSHVIGIDGDGVVLMNLMDTAAAVPALTGVYENAGQLYLTTLFGHVLPRLDKTDLAVQ